MVSGNGFKSPLWYNRELNLPNMCNLSFFNGRSFIPPYKDLSIANLRNKKHWSYLIIQETGSIEIVDGKELRSVPTSDTAGINYLAAGCPLLVFNGKKCKIKRSYFARRTCARTAIGILPDNTVILFISTAATLKDLQDYFISVGCTSALNFDGGSSTFLYVGNQLIFSSKEGRTYPNVLYW
jgi:exopolysaccharide biosynthesis protein